MPQPRSKNQNTLRGRASWWPLGVAVVVGLLIVAVGVWWVQAGGTPQGNAPGTAIQTPLTEPRLAVDRDIIDVGTQPFERRVSAVFEVQNVGGSTLHILEEPFVELVEGC